MKKILIAARELDCGGTEVAMLNLLKNLNSSRFDITLLLFRKRGVYLSKIPSYVKVVEIPFNKEADRYYISDDDKLLKNSIQKIYVKNIRKTISYINRYVKKVNYRKDLYYKFLLNKTYELNEEFDLVLDFFGYGGFQTAYVAEKVKAKNKIMWIHDERIKIMKTTRCFFDKFTYFFGVSKACVNSFVRAFPETKDRIDVFYNFIDINEILKKAEEKIGIEFEKDKFNLVTVGRLEWQKGYDIAIEVAKRLRDENISFCWYVLGDGSCREALQSKINYYKLNDKFILLGRVDNPYPYIKKSNLYIQTSRHEGYGLAIAEARVLNKGIVSTDLECVREQIINGETGYLVPCNVNEFSNILLTLHNNEGLIKILENNLKGEKESYEKELLKLEEFL